MKTLYSLVLVSLVVACGGVAPDPTPTDAGPLPDSATDAAPAVDAAPDVVVGVDAAPDADSDAYTPFCECVGADFGTYMCGGVQAPDAESCAYCGGHCNSNADQ